MQKHTIELERETQKEELAFKKQVKELGSGFEVRLLLLVGGVKNMLPFLDGGVEHGVANLTLPSVRF